MKKELELTNIMKENYEKQIKDLKNNYEKQLKELKNNYDCFKEEVNSKMSDKMTSVEFEQEINDLKKIIENRDQEITEYLKKLEEANKTNVKLQEESEKLKNGLATAYAQCALFEEKLDQTLGFGETKFEESSILDQSTSSSTASGEFEELFQKQLNYNKVLKKLDACKKQLEDCENEKLSLIHELEEKNYIIGEYFFF